MNKPQMIALAAVLAVGLAAGGFYIWKAGEQSGPDQAPPITPVEENPAPTSTPQIGTRFEDSFLTGFEGVNFRITYGFEYPDMSSVYQSGGGYEVRVAGERGEQLLRFYSNDGAGFDNTDEIFKVHKEQLCPTCVKTANVPAFPALQNIKTIGAFENATTKVVIAILEGEPDTNMFMEVKISKPESSFETIRKTLRVTQVRTNEQIREQTVKLYFVPKGSEMTTCRETQEVERIIFLTTPRIGMITLENLLRGPYPSDDALTSIPGGSRLNSLSIRDGVAHADFDATTESGGGSCSMASRTEQIRKTLLQFPSIKEVKLSINGRTGDIFQP